MSESDTSVSLYMTQLVLMETIRETIITTGPAVAKGNLMRMAIKISREIPGTKYENLDELETAAKAGKYPITLIEGVATRDGNIFVVNSCPFNSSVKMYKELFHSIPAEYVRLMEEFNKPYKSPADLYLGHGSGGSPFCAIHQPFRAAIGKNTTVGGMSANIIHLGCKDWDGNKHISDELCNVAGVSKEAVEKYLDKGDCVYYVKPIEKGN